MSQRNSGYERIAGDTYVTPRWVWEVLHEVEPWSKHPRCADPAPAPRNGYDFLTDLFPFPDGIACNPPYKLAEKFVRHALDLPGERNIAMLLPHAWDCAKTRVDLFTDQRFHRKYTLTRRIQWDNLEHTATPSSNHAWFVWRSEPRGFIRPTMGWI